MKIHQILGKINQYGIIIIEISGTRVVYFN